MKIFYKILENITTKNFETLSLKAIELKFFKKKL